jgi:hypothetical protein
MSQFFMPRNPKLEYMNTKEYKLKYVNNWMYETIVHILSVPPVRIALTEA